MYRSNQELDIPAALGSLSSYTKDALNDLLNNDEKFEELIKDNKQVF